MDIVEAWINAFHYCLLFTARNNTGSAWHQAAGHLLQLGVTNPLPGKCACVVDGWIPGTNEVAPLVHQTHLEFNSVIWHIIKRHNATLPLRQALVAELLTLNCPHLERKGAELLEHFLIPDPSPLWVVRYDLIVAAAEQRYIHLV
jgi:hypothetical protein